MWLAIYSGDEKIHIVLKSVQELVSDTHIPLSQLNQVALFLFVWLQEFPKFPTPSFCFLFVLKIVNILYCTGLEAAQQIQSYKDH